MLPFWTRIPRAEKIAVGLSFTLGVVLLVVKFVAYFLTQSSAIFSDAVESIVNVLASGIALWALALAHTPPDKNHPYGHGKVEFISAAFEGGMIVLAGMFVFVQTLNQVLFHTIGPQRLDWGLALVVLATVLNGTAGVVLVRVGRRQESLTLEADGLHLLADVVTSVAVVGSLLVVKYTSWAWADPVTAFGISVYITAAGLRVARRSFAGLMDQQDLADEAKISHVLDAHAAPGGPQPRICSYHKLRHRHSGRFHWVDFHIMVPSRLSVADGHRVASSIEYEIERALGTGNATAHVEPCEDRDCQSCGRE